MKEWLGQSFDLSVDGGGGGTSEAGTTKASGRRRTRPTSSSSYQDGANNNHQAHHKLDWSLDPHHADWIIEIINKEDSTSTCYQVHKIILAVGPWKCNYFEKILEYQKEKEKLAAMAAAASVVTAGGAADDDDATVNTTNTRATVSENKRIRVKLNKLAADVFPLLLDYCYGAPTASLKISTRTATGLHCLGTCFENKWLNWESKQFIQHDLSVENCHLYYVHAKILLDDYVLSQITQLLVVNLKSLLVVVERNNGTGVDNDDDNRDDDDVNDEQQNKYHPMIKVADVEFWLPIFEKRRQQNNNNNNNNNNNSSQEQQPEYADTIIPPDLIVDICEWNATYTENGIEQDIFDKLTCEDYMPYVDPDIGARLLEIYPIVDKLTSLHVRILTRAPPNFILDVCERLCLNMTPDVFEIITSEEFLPNIISDDMDINKDNNNNHDGSNHNPSSKCDIACRLLRIEPKFRVLPTTTTTTGSHNNKDEDQLTPLQQRCLQTFIDNWATLSDHKQIVDFLQTQNPLFLQHICLGTATQLYDINYRLESMQSVLNKTLIREHETRQDYEKEIERLNELLCNSMVALK